MQKYKILVLNENTEIINNLKTDFEKDNFEVLFALNEVDGLKVFKNKSPALVVCGLSMDFIRTVLKISNIPVVVLDESNELTDKVVCFEMGCDDYITIPYENKELICRIKAVLRRYNSSIGNEKVLVFNGLTVDLDGYSIITDGVKKDIPPKELELLHYLASNPNVTFTREQILDKVWGFDYYGDTRTVDVHVDRLRKKLKGYEKGWKIDTVFGVGYKFTVN